MRELVRAYVSANSDAATALVWTPEGESGAPTALSLMRVFHPPRNGEERPGVAALQFMAPAPDTHSRVEAWADLAEGQAQLAARHGAIHTLAEAPEDSGEADALRAAGFTAWIHQDALKLGAPPPHVEGEPAPWLREMSGEADALSARLLTLRLTPKPLHRADVTPDLIRLAHRPAHAYLAVDEGEPQGWLAVYGGRRANAIHLCFRPEAERLVRPALRHALARLGRRAQRPVYCMVPSFASWMLSALDEVGFAHVATHVIMIRSSLAAVRQPVWSVELATARKKVIARHNSGAPSRPSSLYDSTR